MDGVCPTTGVDVARRRSVPSGMAMDRVGALRAEREAVVTFCRGLAPDEWSTPSRCPGWTIQDVVAHMGAACHGTFTPWVLKMMRSKAIERANDADVAARREWSAKRVFGEYEVWSRRFAAVQVGLQRPPLRSIPIRLGELGSYPARLLASAIVFDSHVHLRHDMAPAVDRTVAPSDAGRIAVVVEWMMAGLPTMSGDALKWMDRPVEITLRGDGGGQWGVVPGPDGRAGVVAGPVGDPAARIGAPVASFPIWATRRQPWRSADIEVQGDEGVGSRFLDSVIVV